MKTITFDGFGYRLIPSRFPAIEVYRGLVASDRFDDLYALEAETNPRLRSKESVAAKYGGEGSPRLQNWNHAPFRYFNPEGSRFFPAVRPALELADNPQTAIVRAVRKREVFLARTSEPPIGIDMRMLKTPISGMFADLTHLPLDLDREACFAAGRGVDEQLAGAAFIAPERPGTICFAITDAGALGTTIQTVHYRFEWNGDRISKLYAFTDKGEDWDPELLRGESEYIAA